VEVIGTKRQVNLASGQDLWDSEGMLTHSK